MAVFGHMRSVLAAFSILTSWGFGVRGSARRSLELMIASMNFFVG